MGHKKVWRNFFPRRRREYILGCCLWTVEIRNSFVAKFWIFNGELKFLVVDERRGDGRKNLAPIHVERTFLPSNNFKLFFPSSSRISNSSPLLWLHAQHCANFYVVLEKTTWSLFSVSPDALRNLSLNLLNRNHRRRRLVLIYLLNWSWLRSRDPFSKYLSAVEARNR